MKILLIDDDKWYSESLTSSLKLEKNIEIKSVLNPDEAIEIIDDFYPDCILLDFNLGVKNALVVMNELQSYSDTRKIPVVLLVDNIKLNIPDLKEYNVKAILNKATTTPKEIVKCLKV